jgi:hypothetical protein
LNSQPLSEGREIERYRLINQILGLSIKVPNEMEPLVYLTSELHKLCEMPKNYSLPLGLDYANKHSGLWDFAREISIVSDKTIVDDFFQEAVLENHLTPQIQRSGGKIMLPKELETPSSKITLRSTERLKLALREVTSDWEALVNLIYGLKLIYNGHRKNWIGVRSVSLFDKMKLLRDDPLLTFLVKEDWITIRNSLDHGRAFFNPVDNTMEFQDKTREISLTISQAYREGQDIYLSNAAMVKIEGFIRAAYWLPFEPWIMEMSEKTY